MKRAWKERQELSQTDEVRHPFFHSFPANPIGSAPTQSAVFLLPTQQISSGLFHVSDSRSNPKYKQYALSKKRSKSCHPCVTILCPANKRQIRNPTV